MGLIISKVMDKINELASGHQTRILMIGLDAAGKTTVLYKLKCAPPPSRPLRPAPRANLHTHAPSLSRSPPPAIAGLTSW